MSTASDVCIPLEILREFILQSSPSPSTLAAWCSVSRSLLSFAGPLLYRSVALKRSEDVIPFLKRLRLARSSSPTPPSSSLLLPFVKGIQRLEIFAIPDWRDLLNFTNRRFTTQSRADLVLVVNWEGQIEEQMGSFFVPRLLLEILPTSYEEIGKKYNAIFPPTVLDTYLPHLSSEHLPSFATSHLRSALEQEYWHIAFLLAHYRTFNQNLRSRVIDLLFDLFQGSSESSSDEEVEDPVEHGDFYQIKRDLKTVDYFSPFRAGEDVPLWIGVDGIRMILLMATEAMKRLEEEIAFQEQSRASLVEQEHETRDFGLEESDSLVDAGVETVGRDGERDGEKWERFRMEYPEL